MLVGFHPQPKGVIGIQGVWHWLLMDSPSNTHKAHLIARGFTQACGIDNTKMFYLVVHLIFVFTLLFLVVNQAWSLHYLDASNIFLHGDLKE